MFRCGIIVLRGETYTMQRLNDIKTSLQDLLDSERIESELQSEFHEANTFSLYATTKFYERDNTEIEKVLFYINGDIDNFDIMAGESFIRTSASEVKYISGILGEWRAGQLGITKRDENKATLQLIGQLMEVEQINGYLYKLGILIQHSMVSPTKLNINLAYSINDEYGQISLGMADIVKENGINRMEICIHTSNLEELYSSMPEENKEVIAGAVDKIIKYYQKTFGGEQVIC